jgi:UDP-3-O-[3-hydroxymyristoyl] glucosamine N-acyltransferase
MTLKLSQIAQIINGELIGSDVVINGISDLETQRKDTICYAENDRYLKMLAQSEVAAIIISKKMVCDVKPIIVVEDPKIAFAQLLEIFNPHIHYITGITENVFIDKTVKLGKNVSIMPFSSVFANSEIGDDTIIYPNVFIGNNVKIGKRCVLMSGVRINSESEIGDEVTIEYNSVVGSEGFGYIQKDGKNIKIPQIGKVVIKNNVHICACVTIDRATVGETVIEEGVKIDNLVQIAHNVRVGSNSMLISQSGVAGSSRIGKNCIIAGQVAIIDHSTIGDNVIVGGQSAVVDKKVESGKMMLGSPARDFLDQKRIYAAEVQLPDMVKKVNEMVKILKKAGLMKE